MYYATDQLYKILTLRHRNNQMILKFLIFWQQFGWNPYCFPRIENEDILDSEYLHYRRAKLQAKVRMLFIKDNFSILDTTLVQTHRRASS